MLKTCAAIVTTKVDARSSAGTVNITIDPCMHEECARCAICTIITKPGRLYERQVIKTKYGVFKLVWFIFIYVNYSRSNELFNAMTWGENNNEIFHKEYLSKNPVQ